MDSIGTFIPLEAIAQRAGIDHRAVLRPSIHIEEVRTIPGDLIGGEGNPKLTVHLKDAGPRRFAHRSLHLCPHTQVPMKILTRTDPPRQEVSVALQDKDKDWDFLERHRDLVFDTKRIHYHDSTWDKVWALAEDIWTFRREIQKPGGNDFSKACPWSHPVDTLIYGSWCLGGAYALVGLCATIGVPAREISICGHSQAEAYIDGQWCFIESIPRFAKDGGTNMVRTPFAEIRLDPFHEKYAFATEQRQAYWETVYLHYSFADNGLWLQQHEHTPYCPQTAMALYPGWTDPRFKSNKPDRYDLLPGPANPGGGQYPELLVRKGQAFQRRFWVGSLAETAGMVATFGGGAAAGVASHHVPEGGGDWLLAVNGTAHPIRDQGGWDFHKAGADDGDTWKHRFNIPLDELTENDWNTLAIGAEGSGNEFLWFGGAADASLPDEPCLCPRVGE